MSTTLLRLGLWMVILIIVLYVLDTTYAEEPWTELIDVQVLQRSLYLVAAVLIAGVVMRILEKGTRVVVAKNRCRVCRREIVTGALYCREHLRSILQEEDDRAHMTRVRK
jgi:hypothetical protein